MQKGRLTPNGVPDPQRSSHLTPNEFYFLVSAMTS